MDRLVEKLWTFVKHGADEISLEVRFFRLICLTVSFVALVLVLPTNLIQDLSPYLNLVVVLYGAASLLIYYRSWRGSQHFVGFYLLTLVLLAIAWFLNAGSSGSIGYYFFACSMYPVIFFRGRTRQAMFLLLVLVVCGLLLLDFRSPQLVIPYKSGLDRLLDLSTGFSFSALIFALVFWVVITTLERELDERRKAEAAARQERDRAQGYLDTVETLIVALDAEGHISTINRKACEVLGYQEKELLGRDWFASCLPQPLGSERAAIYRRTMAAGSAAEVAHLESPLVTRTGGVRQIVWPYSVLRDEAGNCLGALGSGEDITERKLAEEALRQSEQALRLKTALLEAQSDATLDAVLVVDNDKRIAFYNRQFLEVFEVPERVLGEPDNSALLRHALGLVRCPDLFLKRVLYLYDHPRESSRDEIEMKNGRILDRYSAAVISRDGYCYGRMWTFRDVTERRRFESERVKIEKLESLGVLAGGIAHDFNNILAGIMGGISFAQEFIPEDHPAHGPLQTAELASVRAADLARQLITFARGGDLVKKPVALQLVIEEAVSFALRGSNVKGSVTLTGSLHPVLADEGQLGQAIYNLIINAKQAMPGGGIVTLSANNETLGPDNPYGLPGGDYVRVCCADQGCGIGLEDQVKIFDPYFTTKSCGTGLGLASAYSIVKKHGGSISVASEPGNGAAFTVLLPASSAPTHSLFSSPPPQELVSHPGGSILVMDDEPLVRDLAREMLRYIGYQVTTCENGSEAISLYQAAKEAGHAFDAIVMDLTIPGGMGGKEAAQRILAYDPDACLIVSSGYSNDPVMADHRAYGFRGAVAKPYKNRELWQLLSSLLGGAGGACAGGGGEPE
ncbi:hypothetical protein GMST_38720 [Geomonas silvestris]|uniref:histidine kinase n=1 Tax=Geomonas silvestris TaxID=2740184 RepID=A0A6V8MNU1_9BACT|nr:PAS domain-containing sensor histidine kinase [Geomonas silvestris]GFO61547.1 hypothetical protein GMST_38720 [Geomonas silvestris]